MSKESKPESVEAKIDRAMEATPEQQEANTVLKGKDIEANKEAVDNGTQEFHMSEDLKVTEPHLKGAFDMHNDPINLVHTDVIETPLVRKEVRVINEGNVDSDKDFLDKYAMQPEVSPEKLQAKKDELAARAKNK